MHISGSARVACCGVAFGLVLLAASPAGAFVNASLGLGAAPGHGAKIAAVFEPASPDGSGLLTLIAAGGNGRGLALGRNGNSPGNAVGHGKSNLRNVGQQVAQRAICHRPGNPHDRFAGSGPPGPPKNRPGFTPPGPPPFVPPPFCPSEH